MPNEQIVVDRNAQWRLQQARALLELFEKDCGRPATTTEEVRAWACAQIQEHLVFRVTLQVHGLEISAPPRGSP
jgi:hypothetical protein